MPAAKAEWSGVLELEAGAAETYGGVTETDMSVATIELGFAHSVNPNVDFEMVLLFEEGDTEPLEVDQASMNIFNLHPNVEFSLGRQYLPFGIFSTSLINDPLTLELGETRQTSIIINTVELPVNFYTSVFKPDITHSKDNWLPEWSIGAHFHYIKSINFQLNIFYISELTSSDSLTEAVAELESLSERTPGTGIAAQLGFNNLLADAECISAVKEFNNPVVNGQQVQACHLELAYKFAKTQWDWVLAAAYSATREAAFLELPENRYSIGIQVEPVQNVTLATELVTDQDYAKKDGGSGKRANSVVAKLAIEF